MKCENGFICDELGCNKKAIRFFGKDKIISFCDEHGQRWADFLYNSIKRYEEVSTKIKKSIRENKEYWESIKK